MALWSSGVEWIAGVDEAGVGPLAGPVVAAAVILPAGPAPARPGRLEEAGRADRATGWPPR